MLAPPCMERDVHSNVARGMRRPGGETLDSMDSSNHSRVQPEVPKTGSRLSAPALSRLSMPASARPAPASVNDPSPMLAPDQDQHQHWLPTPESAADAMCPWALAPDYQCQCRLPTLDHNSLSLLHYGDGSQHHFEEELVINRLQAVSPNSVLAADSMAPAADTDSTSSPDSTEALGNRLRAFCRCQRWLFPPH